MKRLNDQELREYYAGACDRVSIGKLYKHLKSGRYYAPVGIALNENNLEPLVLYRAAIGCSEGKPVWSRTLSNWESSFAVVPDPRK